MSSVLWRDLQTGGLDRCVLEEGRGASTLIGTVLTVCAGVAMEVRYFIEADEAWRTRLAEVWLDQRLVRTLESDGAGKWRLGSEPAPALAGCLDIDLGITPATNTLAIRRLGLEPGQAADLEAAWVRFPELDVRVSHQRYERLSADRYHYSDATYEADLRVGPDGLVLDYEGAWQAVAHG